MTCAMQNVHAHQSLLRTPLGRLKLPRTCMLALGAQRHSTQRSVRLSGVVPQLASRMLRASKDTEVSVQTLRRAARAAEIMIYTVERELPETAAALRLSSLELSDAIEEVSLLSNDVSSGVRASAAAVVAAEQGVRQGAQYLDLAVKNAVIPTVKKKVPAARDAVETQLLQNAELKHTAPDLRQLASSSRQLTERLRFGLGVLQVLRRAATAQQQLRLRLLLGSS